MSEEHCETCGKGRRKPYRYSWRPAAVAQGGVNWPLFVFVLASSVAFGIWMGLVMILARAWGDLWLD